MDWFLNKGLSGRAKALGCFVCALLITCSSGCQIAPKDKSFKWPWKKDESKPLPDRILPVWTDSVLHQPSQPGVRGFGGRIYFYAKDDTDPIEIDGSLAVYVFDADDISVSSQKPLRKFVFTADQFKEHMSKTSIGPSYSIWLPWGEIGGPPRRLSLIARFEGRDGGTTISDPTIKLLPGVPAKEQSDEQVAGSKAGSQSLFRLSGHQKRVTSKADQDEVVEETIEEPKNAIKTIDLPPSFQRHLRGNPNEAAKPATKPMEIEAASLNGSRGGVSETVSTEQQLVEANGQSEDAVAVPPVTTQVFDYRTRKRQGASAFGSPNNDIRQGRWINSIERD
jgi:hypothetical protein